MARPIRVLHAVPGVGRGGGVKTWLMNVLRVIDRTEFQFDFLVHKSRRSYDYDYEEEMESLGARVLPIRYPIPNPRAYLRDIGRTIAQAGPFDIVHAHGFIIIGPPLRMAALSGVPVRIAHSHNAPKGAQFVQTTMLSAPSQYWMRRYMTHGLGCSAAACDALLGPAWRNDPRCGLLYIGLDWTPFRAPVDVAATRASLGLPPDALVIGHVGRFDAQKNHQFWIEVAARIAAQHQHAYFLLVGEGPLLEPLRAQVRRRGLAQRFVFTGVRPDVPRLLQAMDVFLFPSRYEGLPITVLEAQAVGLPCVISDSITPETTVIPPQIRPLSLRAPVETWARTVLEVARAHNRRQHHASAWETVAHSAFAVADCVERLTAIYRAALVGEPLARAGAMLSASTG